MTENPPLLIDFNRPVMVGKENEYMAQAIAAAKFSGDGPFTRKAQRPARAAARRPQGAADHFLHPRAGDGRPPARYPAGRRSHHARRSPLSPRSTPSSCAAPSRSSPTSARIRSTWTKPGWKRLITPRTKAIVPVHYAGVGCEMDAIMDIAGRTISAGRGGQRARAVRQVQGQAPGHLRRPGHAELPRDQELHLRRGRRAADQRSAILSSAPRSSAKRAPTAAASSAARWTSTPGWTSVPATCRRTSWRRSCTPSWKQREQIQYAAQADLELSTMSS